MSGVYPLLATLVYGLWLTGTTDGQKSQAEYVEVVETAIYSSPRISTQRFPDTLTLTFGMGQGQVNSTLRWNSHVKGNLPVYLGKDGRITRWNSDNTTIRFAAYYNQDIKASLIAVPVQGHDVKLGLYGSFMVNDNHMDIEPAPEIRQGRRRRRRKRRQPGAETNTVRHMVYPQQVLEEEANYFDYKMEMSNKQGAEFMFRDDPRVPVRVERQREGGRMKDQVDKISGGSDTGTGQPQIPQHAVEALVLVDYDLYKSWLSRSSKSSSQEREEETILRLQHYFAHVANAVDMRFMGIQDSDLAIHVRPTGLYIAMESAMAPWIETSKTPDPASDLFFVNADPTLTSLQGWLDNNQSQLPQADIGLLFTRNYLLSPYGKRILGLAVMHSICTRYSVAVIRDLGQYSTVQTTAHEIGHCMGAYHDGTENGCSGTKVMGNTREALDFSSCSVTDFRSFLAWLSSRDENCLLDGPSDSEDDSDSGSADDTADGQMFTPDEQCQKLYGPRSYYCGGRERDAQLCAEMQCWDPARSVCYRTSTQKALAGTTCGNQKWCENGKCVRNSKAPSAPDTCVYGDFKGRIQNGRTCPEMMGETPWFCYDALYRDNCCASCDDLSNPHEPECEFGDKDHECSYLKPSECYKQEKATLCCDMCATQRRDNPGCEYGDKEERCADIIQGNRDCYDYGDICCETCRQYHTQNQGCLFGDKAAICARMEPRSCYSNEDACCKSCPDMRRDKPGCEYGDRSAACATVKAYDCYQRNVSCCLSCEKYLTGVPDCEFGDRSPVCSHSDCTSDQGRHRCCRTCASFVPTSLPPISTTISTTTTAGISMTTNRQITTTLASLTSTQRSITRPPAVCPGGDKAKWCRDMPSRDCYVNSDVCCASCPSHHTGVPGCEYGDHFSWCKDMTQQQCRKYSLECCVSCSQVTTNPASVAAATLLPWTGCSGDDRAKWCINIHPWDCYRSDGTCCATCRRFHVGVRGCVYGDRVSWCSRAIKSPRDCQRRDIKDNCCQSCTQYMQDRETTTLTPVMTTPGSSGISKTTTEEFFKNCERDKWTDFCADIRNNPQFCYHDKDNCCASCKPHFSSVAGCEFGDRVSWCPHHIMHGGSCYAHDLAYQCCKSCSRFYTNIIGCEFGDRKESCSPRDCNHPETRAECCHTCAPTTVTPLTTTPSSLVTGECVGEDKADYCFGLDPSFCYYDRVYHNCCSTCSRMKRANNPRCQFGDRRTWCPTIIASECRYHKEECCHTCA